MKADRMQIGHDAERGAAERGAAERGAAERGTAQRGTAEREVAQSASADRAASTREALLAAAREVFVVQGYAQAGVTDIVALAGASVGSLYHHFSGKADLYLVLFDQLQRQQEVRTRRAAAECRKAGVSDPRLILLAGARGYLDVCIEQRDMVRTFARGDGPPGFGKLWGKRLAAWVRRNAEFFARSGEPLDEAAALLLTGGLWLVANEVARAPDEAGARHLAEAALEVLSRLRFALS